ncbi:MAG TPA: pepsin/retropepsin-like aspartic protease family protein [Rhizomicrobium sp.]
MKTRLAFAALALALLPRLALADDCRLTQVTSLPITWSADRSILVPATIEDHDELLLIDTAGVYNLLAAQAADDLHLARRAMNQQTHMTLGVNGKLMSEGAIAHSFKLGNITADRMQFAIIPDTKMLREKAVGTLGPSVMANYDVEIDPANSRFNLFAQNHCPGQVVYWTRTSYASVPMRVDSFLHIIIPVELDGHTFEATVDTGSSESWIQYDLAAGSFGWSADSRDLTHDDPAHPDSPWYRYGFKTLSLNGVDIRNPHIAVHKEPGSSGGMTPIIIGMDVLGKLHTFISYSDKTLYFTGANAPPPADTAPPPTAH